MITMIPRHRLEPHPDNPRKELGDLSELAASIRRQGLLQNLTVVPHPEKEGKYRIVIGHRRYSASGIAGMNELPCVIDDKMTYAEQLAVMMSENIQRNDLTVAERVGGVQLMMDLGMSTIKIAEQTGISDSTVRRYARLSGLDRAAMRKAEGRGATLMQLAEIANIEDAADRQHVLDAAGTDNYLRAMHTAKAAAARRKMLPLITELLDKFASRQETVTVGGTVYEGSFWPDQKDVLEDVRKFRPDKKAQYVYVISGGGTSVTLYRVRDSAKEDAAREEKEAARARVKERIVREGQAAAEFGKMRLAWIKDMTGMRGREEAAMRFVLWAFSRTSYLDPVKTGGAYEYGFVAECDKKTNSVGTLLLDQAHIDGIGGRELLSALVCAAFDRISQGEMTLLDRYTGAPKDDAPVRDLYHYIEQLGYPVSSDERAWLDGTHECYGEAHADE